MRTPRSNRCPGFSLVETVIAIGVVAVLLSGFLIVFAPAAAGIKDSINSKSATRLTNTLEQELVSLRGATQSATYATGFDKAYDYIRQSAGVDPENALIVYQYRASLTRVRGDGTPEPFDESVDGEPVPGSNFVVRNMMRRKGDAEFTNDIPVMEGPAYLVKCTQMLLNETTGQMELATPGQLANSDQPLTDVSDPDNYTHAVVTFVADFYSLPSRGAGFFSSQFDTLFPTVSRPMFSRNLAVRR